MNKRKTTRPYLPTEQQIQRNCTEIQCAWSERERRRREVRPERKVTIPFYSARSVGVGLLDLDRDDLEVEVVALPR